MPSLPLYDLSKKKVGNIDLNDAVFAGDIRPHLLNDAVRAQLAWKYEFKTANSRTRTEVQGTRKKVYKRHGSGTTRR
jgi:large subunit ribosomal protein L4